MQNQPDDPLAFDPVPRRHERVDGWTAERQRVFIKTLAITGSPRRAAALMGKSPNGVDNLRRAPGSESFCAAWDRALAMAQQVGRDRLEKGLDQARREDAAWALEPAPWTGPRRAAPQPQAPDEDDDDDAKRELLESILHKYMLKLEREREARLEGRIAEADFLIRQVTALEVALDVVSGNAIEQLHAARANGHLLIDVAETPITRLLDEARCAHWEACGDPPRPDRPAPWLKEDEDGYAIEPTESYAGGTDQTIDEQHEAYLRRYAEAAREQVKWEAEARRLASDRP